MKWGGVCGWVCRRAGGLCWVGGLVDWWMDQVGGDVGTMGMGICREVRIADELILLVLDSVLDLILALLLLVLVLGTVVFWVVCGVDNCGYDGGVVDIMVVACAARSASGCTARSIFGSWTSRKPSSRTRDPIRTRTMIKDLVNRTRTKVWRVGGWVVCVVGLGGCVGGLCW